MSLARLLAAAAACSVLLARPTQAVVLDARQDLPEALQGPALPLTPLFPRPPPTVMVTTQLSVTVTPATDSPRPPPPTDSASIPPPTSVPAPPPGDSPIGGTSVGQGEPTATDTLVNDMPFSTGISPSTTDSSQGTVSPEGGSNGIGSNRTLVIALGTVLPVLGLLLILCAILACRRHRKGRFPFARGVSPIGDDEIATWKVPRGEKAPLTSGDATGEFGAGAAAGATMVGAAAHRDSNDRLSHSRHVSTSSLKKPPSVIVYSNPQTQGVHRKSTDNSSPRSVVSHDSGHAGTPPYKMGLEKVLPPPPVQAKAPNARVGLTDESIPGDEPYLKTPKRQPSRLSKVPPGFTSSQRRHLRTRSSRSSTRSFGDYAYGASDLDFAQRHSHDYIPRSHGHWRVYSSSSIPPRLSFSDDSVFGGGLSPRPLLADQEIGRAIG